VASVMRTFRLENRYCKNIIISKTSARFQSLLTVLYSMHYQHFCYLFL
jgi:hypothetical protein